MHYIGTVVGLFGILKYVLDRTMVDSLRKFQNALRDSLRESGKLSHDAQNQLAVDVATRMWSTLVDDPAKHEITLFSKVGSLASSLYCFVVPDALRYVLFIPTYLITLPVRLFVNKKKVEAVRAQTRRMAVEGLWSFTLPLSVAILTASILVQEVQYVRVVNGRGPPVPGRTP